MKKWSERCNAEEILAQKERIEGEYKQATVLSELS